MAAIASQLVFHPAVNQSLKYAATTVGRDKVYRAVQYFARFYAWYLLTRGDDKANAARWTALKSHLGTARKLMRLGKPVEHLQAALKNAFAPAPPAETITSVARQVAYFGYLSYDVAIWANTIKFINLAPETAKRIAKTSFRFWFAGIVFSLINGILKSRRLAAEAKKLKQSRPWGEKDLAEEAARETRLEAVQTARLATRQQLTIDLLDVWIPATGSELVSVNEGTLGLLGLLSSILGIQNQWNAVNKK
ncbi:peroxisomal biogenesis factor [Coprinopsis cinerea okayama7|uniref:Peroxisomal biogenesis factor n=1 Tax=Coprinopsis cinerea (strain Okayama-7 / 130 / ATCC MYA-4618 / FGSC 9003) TaxID=240176 RepID=A8N1T3_COPC7|nr:peroxisomal biogenesis factor [Coprinopsis cinerea okayama7\|eukprot:XP_001828832.1 peroxisomal biogenesis factor [Coprinopsis cinerea okayama7\